VFPYKDISRCQKIMGFNQRTFKVYKIKQATNLIPSLGVSDPRTVFLPEIFFQDLGVENMR
jgi:hypothetical protein